MKILLTFNDSYAPHAATVITGLLKYSTVPLSVAIMYTELTEDTINKFKTYYSDRLESLEFYKIDINGKLAEKLIRVKSQTHLIGKIEPYIRLFAPLYLKDDGVMYLDCDIVVNGDIARVLDEIHGDEYCYGVQEYDPHHKFSDYTKLTQYTIPDYKVYFYREAFFTRLIKFYNMDEDASYMCDGIMYMNLKKWRQDNLVDRFIKNIDKYGFFFSADQDILNCTINGKFGKISPKWNTIVMGAGIITNYSSEQFEEAKEKPIIVHMPGAAKPWNKSFGGEYRRMYWKYRIDTPWPEYYKRGLIKRLGTLPLLYNYYIEKLSYTFLKLKYNSKDSDSWLNIFAKAYLFENGIIQKSNE